MAKIKKGDLVQVITGRKAERGGDRGKQGKVIAVFPEQNRVLVEGVNRVKKHQRAGQTASGTTEGGIVEVEAPLHISNVAIVDPESKKPSRIGYRLETAERNGKEKTVRVRISKASGKDL